MQRVNLLKSEKEKVQNLFDSLINSRKTKTKIYEGTLLKHLKLLYPEIYKLYFTFVGQSDVRFLSVRNKLFLFLGGAKGKCLTCGSPTKWVRGKNHHKYAEFCSNKCNLISSSTREKIRKTSLLRYGVEHYTLAKSVQDKAKITNVKNCGYEHHSKSPESKAKHKATCLEKYGVDNPSKCPEHKAKRTATIQRIYGVDNAFKSETVKKKIRKVCLDRYGFENPMQSLETQQKAKLSCFRSKLYTLGKREVVVRGFEPQALDFLTTVEKIKPTLIFTDGDKCMPQIKYKLSKDKSYHYHTPDIYIPSRNLLIEVKSTRTLLRSDKCFKRICEKAKAAMRAGFSYRLMLMSEKGSEIKLPKYWYLSTKHRIDNILRLRRTIKKRNKK